MRKRVAGHQVAEAEVVISEALVAQVAEVVGGLATPDEVQAAGGARTTPTKHEAEIISASLSTQYSSRVVWSVFRVCSRLSRVPGSRVILLTFCLQFCNVCRGSVLWGYFGVLGLLYATFSSAMHCADLSSGLSRQGSCASDIF